MSKLNQLSSLFVVFFVMLAGAEAIAANKVVVIPLDDDRTLKNVVTVAKAHGSFTNPVVAVNSISNASAANHYVVAIGPGIYTISQTLVMKEHVDIVGAGEHVTKLQGAISTTNGDASSALVSGANNAALRSLTVENAGGSTYSIALYNNNASPAVSDLSFDASGGSDNYGVYNSSSSPAMTHITATASGGENNYGVCNSGSSSPTMMDVTATASDGATNNYGVRNSSSSPTMKRVTATASGGLGSYGIYNDSSSPAMTTVTATASDGTFTCGVYNSSLSPTMTDVTATAYGGSSSYGVYNYGSSPVMTRVIASASGGTNNNYGVYNWNSSSPAIRRSKMEGATHSLFTDTGCAASVSQATIVEPGGVGGNGTNKCVACDNGNGTALEADCTSP